MHCKYRSYRTWEKYLGRYPPSEKSDRRPCILIFGNFTQSLKVRVSNTTHIFTLSSAAIPRCCGCPLPLKV